VVQHPNEKFRKFSRVEGVYEGLGRLRDLWGS
jgi:hypothetical protein